MDVAAGLAARCGEGSQGFGAGEMRQGEET